jgi:hypothetical protein
MEKQLVSNQIENKYNFNKLAKAIDYLSAAAAIFEQVGLYKEAEEVTEVIEDISPEGDQTDPQESDYVSEDYISEDNISEIIKQIKSTNVTSKDLENVFWSSPIGVQIAVLRKLYDLAKGTKQQGFFKTLKNELKKIDVRDPEVLDRLKNEFNSRFMTALKALSLFSKFASEEWEDEISGGVADNYRPDQFDTEELEAGEKVEMEHTTDPKKAKEIAMDHMVETRKSQKGKIKSDYYKELAKLENKLKK